MKLWKRQNITGSDSTVYMKRLIVFECGLFSVRLHTFLRSDHDDPHDHPWSFVSFILTGGYYERRFLDVNNEEIQFFPPGSYLFRKAETRHVVMLAPIKKITGSGCLECNDCGHPNDPGSDCCSDCFGSSLQEIPEQVGEVPATTLVITGPKRRSWYFWKVSNGWLRAIHWKSYLEKLERGEHPCD